MTDQTQPNDPPFEGSTEKTETPVKPRKRAAKKAATPDPEPTPTPSRAERDSAGYLPALPDGYVYTKVEIDGPDGTSIVVGSSVEGNYAVDVETEDFNRSTPYPSFAAAVRGAADRAKLLQKRKAALAAAAALEAEFGE